jgi:hypothetical protein
MIPRDSVTSMTIPEYIIVGLYVFVIGVLLYNGFSGLRGRSVWLPNRSGTGGRAVHGRGARVAGVILILIALFFVFMPFWYAQRH